MAELTFLADFMFTAGPLYSVSPSLLFPSGSACSAFTCCFIDEKAGFMSDIKCYHWYGQRWEPAHAVQAPPLVVTTNLTTESVQGRTQGGQGSRMDKNGFTKYANTSMSLADLLANSVSSCQVYAAIRDLFGKLSTYAACSPFDMILLQACGHR